MKKFLFFALFLLTSVPVVAQQPAPTPFVVEPGTYTARGGFEDTIREYRIYVPEGYSTDAEPYPLVIVLHGAGGNGAGVEAFTGFNRVADEEDFLVVYPDALPGGWNDARPEPTITINDIGFISAMIVGISNNFNVDTTRVYATGYSRGGMMAYLLGCRLHTQIAAVSSVAATMPKYALSLCENAAPVPVMLIQGTEDQGHPAYLTIDETQTYWTDHNGCETTAPTTETFDVDEGDSLYVEKRAFEDCARSTAFVVYEVMGGGHTWPGVQLNAPFDLGPTSVDINATREIWAFFAQHQLRNSLIGIGVSAQ